MKFVHLAGGHPGFKAVYYDRQHCSLRPNLVLIGDDGSVVFETNEVGLKGDRIDPKRKLAVVWGDSVVFGFGRGWPCLLDEKLPGYQFLNGGIEGDPYQNVLCRAGLFNERHPVALNLLMLGWHVFTGSRVLRRRKYGRMAPLISRSSTPGGNESLDADLTRHLKQWPNTAVITMPTALNRVILDLPLSTYCIDGPDADQAFWLYGDRQREVEIQREMFCYIVERNAITREVCARLNIHVIDLFTALKTHNSSDFRENFADVIHPRPRAYPMIAQFIYERIKDLLI